MELHDLPKPKDLMNIDINRPPEKGWMSTPTVFRDGTYSYPAAGKNLKALGMPNPRQWSPADDDWKLPENWKEIILEGLWTFAFAVEHVQTNAIFLSVPEILKTCRC